MELLLLNEVSKAIGDFYYCLQSLTSHPQYYPYIAADAPVAAHQ